MAYQSQTGSCMVSSSSTFPDFRLPGLNNCHHHHSRSSSDIVHRSTEQDRFYSNENLSFDRHDVRHSYPLSQWGVNEADLRLEDFSFDLQCHRAEPVRSDGNPTVTRSNKRQNPAFQDQESIMASNAAYGIPGKSKYSFGIYYPPKPVNVPTGGSSASENMTRGYEDSPQQLSVARPHTFDMNQNPATAYRKKSLDESSAFSSSARSRDLLIRYSSERAANDIKNRFSPRHLVYERSSVENRPANVMSRSQTVSGISPLYSNNPEQSLKQLSDYHKSGSENSLHTNQSQQYIPVYSGNKLPSGEEHSSRGSSVDNGESSVYSEQSGPSSQLKTYKVRLPYEQQRHHQSKSTESSSTPTRQRFGTSCARTPTVMHIELQKSIGKPIVSQRKYQFESGKNENTHVPGVSGFNRYKTEIEKIRTQPKFSSVALRKASFEQSPDRDPLGLDDSVEYEKLAADDSGSMLEAAQPTVKAKSSFMEIYNTPSPHQSSEIKDKLFSMREHYQENVSTKAGMPVGSTQCSSIEGTVQPLQEGAEQSLSKSSQFQPSPDEHFHPPHHDNDAGNGSVGVAGCDISTGSLADSGVWMRSYCGSSDMLDAVDAVSGVSDSGVFSLCGSTTDQEVSSMHSFRPARKPSYLTAVHAPAQRIMSESDSISLSDHPDGQITTEEAFSDGLNSSVTMRKKFQESLEDQTGKLHRRTSYLMATARDRTNNAPLEMTFSSPHVVTDHAPHHSGSSLQHNSSVKLNRFFGEVVMIPSIAEVSETRLSDHEDPLEVIRKGPLLCKISVIEGKKCSDRTWKPVYAILRPTELFLTRDRDSGFTSNYFEDQHIPLKLCMVEFARDYAKKKKNVFRMSTYNECEYLFQAEDRGTLMCWIQGIKTINEPMKADKMEETATSEKEKQMHSPVDIYAGLSSKMSPQLGHKGKKLSALSFKSKLASSPNMKRKKSNAADKEEVIKKGWMDRIPMMKSLKKHNDDTGGLHLAEQDMDSNKFQFGVQLEYCFPSPHNENVPLIVELCTRIVEARGLECVGVYRVPGNSAAVNALTEEFNRGIDSVNIDNEKLLDINVISSLLKSFFRKLPEPLIPTDAYDEFIEANRCPDESKRKLKLKRLLHLLPAHNNETFKHMAEHLNKVASYGNINKMDAKNLAIMFGPTLVRKQGDDTVSLVTDMSDQCRIVESIILHHEWFFGPWDQDSYIPMETTVETVPVDGGQSQSKDDDEEADSAISTKEIISSIVGAASKKLRQKQQKKSLESLDTVDSISIASTSTYKDRSRDDSLNLTRSMASIASSLSDCEDYSAPRLSVPSSPYLQLYRSDPVNKDFKKSEYPAVSFQASPSVSRPQQNSNFLDDKRDELEISHQPAGLSQDAISRLKRIGDDVSALLQTFEQKQLIERENRRREKEMVEREHLRTQLELEQEENHSVEDWLEWKGSLTTARMPDLVSSSYIGDKFSYNQNQSGLVVVNQEKREQNQRKIPLGVQPDAERPSQSLTSLVNYSSYKTGLGQAEVTAFNQSRMSRGGSHEDILSQCRNMGHDAVRPVVMRGPCQRRLQENQQKAMHLTAGGGGGYPASLRNSLGRRHGSLDSLIDMIDKQEKRASWASSDSEDGSDLLTSITATFDQKLQVLLNPKYKLTGTGKRCSRNETAGSTNEGMFDWQNDNIQAKAAAVANTKQMYTVNTLLDSARSYRDPSLHRSARSDPKIGIASRFERNDITRTTSTSPVTPSTNTATNLGKWSKRQLPDFKVFLGKQTSHFKDSNSVILTKPKKLESRINKNRNVSDKRELGLAFKSSQTGKNQILSPSKNEAKFFLGEKPPAGRERFKEETTETITRGARLRYRRHTVSGVEDLAHINALSQVCSEFNLGSYPTSRDRLSAWDQLRPAVNAPGSRNMQAWIQRERLRGSTPDLSVAGLF